ncbi:MAG: hypothetical protein US86_C0005G0061 [Candidatus Daviesbacteria bacterium GW2011_GWA2_38_24]|uniref:Uncharacterized protein n=1 Tax=Candidatus Daviesbacteria bacterium GW2011_GWA2_38_24 TaxID=1618422 RepID=A0A0G0JTT5_9BACT|nr:MAG: hypothetical protein US86_C0005G0061 [Candidatus Daviesbacteria bacterium GW2011_GWA2_38_24]KKQ78667.1 MAG: hypothetical protein UT01_C0063G0002 [Candidatus Daviesbacteria bacterium GW2011_GWA1_38_7]OGE24239.1 MAG: hypothetical protein A2688_02720 [Candidatus Daviesbacteria bacterium RIFCSPHIGHO2_01_FULL_38_8]
MSGSIDIYDYWSQSGGDDLLLGSSFQEIFEKIQNRHHTFELKDNYLRCIDEGTTGGIHLAGSGILYPQAKMDLEGKVTGIFSHEGCGAAKLYVNLNQITTDDPDVVGDEKAKELAENLNVPYLGRISAEAMDRPAHLHTARVVYYDGTGRFDPSRVHSLPQGFVISRKIISDVDYTKKEVEIAIQIAKGSHGFSNLFTEKSPLYLVAVSDHDKTSVPVEQLIKELKEVASGKDYLMVEPLVERVLETVGMEV